MPYPPLVASEASWLCPWTLSVRTWIFRGRGPILDLQSVVVILLLAVTVTRLAVLLAGWMERAGRTEEAGGAVPRRRRLPWRSIAVYSAAQSVVVAGVVLAGLLGLTEVPGSAVSEGLAAGGKQLFNSSIGLEVADRESTPLNPSH